MSQSIMATCSTVASISSLSAVNLEGEFCWHPGRCLANGCRSEEYRPMGANLHVNGSRLVTLRRPRPPSTMIHQLGHLSFGKSSGITSRRDCVNKLQAWPTAQQAGYNSEQESPNKAKALYPRLRFQPLSSKHTVGSQEQHPAAHKEHHPYEGIAIGQRWREIQGVMNWEGLLEPLDPVLRSELIRYGEFAQATYDAFDYNVFSRFCGSCKFRKALLLKKLSLENRGYEVTQYLYATSDIHLPKFFKKPDAPDDEKWSKYSNWIGFVAVCTSPEEIARLGRRDVVVAWRGTVTNFEWMEDIKMSQCPTEVDPRRIGKGSSNSFNSVDLKVELGFMSLYKSKNKDSRFNKSSARDQVLGALKRVMEKYQGEEMSITVTGHSLGGALATLCAYDIAESDINVVPSVPSSTSDNNGAGHGGGYLRKNPIQARVPITAYTFAAPRVGNNAFRDRVDELGVKVLRVANVHDIVPHVPGLILNDILAPTQMRRLRECFLVKLLHEAVALLPATYSHVGVELQLDNLQSPFLKRTRSLFDAHSLEVYLHLLDGHQGKRNGGFDPKKCGGRDLALVNKGNSLLGPEHKIPPFWFQEQNKGLVRIGGRFTYRPREPEDFPQEPLHLDNFDLELELCKKPPVELI